MLHQQLTDLDSRPLSGWARWLPALVAGGAGVTVAVLLLLVTQPLFALVALAAGLAAVVILKSRAAAAVTVMQPVALGPDFTLVGAALELSTEPAALTSSE